MREDTPSRIVHVLAELDAYAPCGGVYHDLGGRQAPQAGRGFCRLCSGCVRHPRAGGFCRQAATAGAYQAMLRGEPYFFRCWLGLNGLVLPVAPRGKDLVGAIEIGGLLRKGELQQRQHEIMATLDAVDPDHRLPRSMSAFQGVEELDMSDVLQLAEFFREAMFSSGLLDADRFAANRSVWEQQQRLAATVSAQDADAVAHVREEAIQEATGAFLKALRAGGKADTQAAVDALLGRLLIASGHDPARLRARLMPPLGILAAEALLQGENWPRGSTRFSRWLEEAGALGDADQLCLWFARLAERQRQRQHEAEPTGGPPIADRVQEYLHRHLRDPIRLGEVAKAVGASPSSVMHKLRAETGRPFSRLLNETRVKEAKRLLAFTALPINEISQRCGFRDQSYFTKVFTRQVNLGPREFRRMLTAEPDPTPSPPPG